MKFYEKAKKHAAGMASRAGEAASEVRYGVKGVWLSKKILKDLEAGTPLEDAILSRVPTLDAQLVRDDAQALLDGIQSLYDTIQHDVDSVWVEQQINKSLSDLDVEKRVAYLRNAVAAVTVSYPDITLDEDASAILARVSSVEEHSDADVQDLLGIMGSVLPQFGELLQRSSTTAMLDRLHKMDHVDVEDQAAFGVNAVTAYAAACYVMQKCGEPLTVNGRREEMSAFSLGAAAAASVESSKLMELYSAGRITLGVLAKKLKNIFTAAATYTFSSMIHFLSAAAYAVSIAAVAEVFLAVFIILGAFLYFSPFWLIAGSLALSAFLITSAFSIEEYEAVVEGAWDLLKSLWSKIKELWNDLTAGVEDAPYEETGVSEDENEFDEVDEQEAFEEEEEKDDIDPDGVFA
ncbi:MAG: hypothetical protein K2O18_01390 [Oscillospiraceae bacterium]|nr:hypothetical protein [Oscillospiraceae bacterium]